MGQKYSNKSTANHLNNENIKPEPVKKHSQTNTKMQNLKRILHKENFSLDREILRSYCPKKRQCENE